MNLVDQLLKSDVKTVDELEIGVFRSRKLAKIIGSKAPVEVKIREVASRRVNDIIAYQVDRNGKFDYSKTYDAKLMMVVEGVVDPDLRSKDLQSHFGCSNGRELAEKLFGSEINDLSDQISALSGMTSDESNIGEEIKN